MADRAKKESGEGEPKPMSMLGLVRRFREVNLTMGNRNFCFILGAGASVSSGIKSAGTMVEEWIETIYREVTNHTGAVPGDWANEKALGIERYDPRNPAGSYSGLYRRMYENDPDSGYAYLEEQMKDADPSFGYSVLGRILAETRHRVVITVNFDNLVADSVSLFSEAYPLVCGHELLAPFVTDKLRRPLVLKVHRDLLLGPLSTEEEIQKIDKGFSDAIGRLLKNYTPIVIGYGGNDGSLMRCLEELPENTIPGGIYWCYREGTKALPERIRRVVAKHKGHLVSIMGFDELLMQFGNELGYPVAEKYVLERAKKRADRIIKQAQELQEKITKGEEEASRVAATVGEQDKPSPMRNEVDAVSDAMSTTMLRQDGDKRWWQWDIEAKSEPDKGKRDGIYHEAIKALPRSSELLGNYAIFLTRMGKHQDAEAMYKQAIDADPKHANNLVNYALFLTGIGKDADAAEVMYRRAIEVAPRDAQGLGNYATFLSRVRKDQKGAEAMYKRAIEADPKHANNLGNYARLLLSSGRVEEGLVMVDEALAHVATDQPGQIEAECWMYAYCCRPAEGRGEALAALKALIVTTDIRTGNWDFGGVIEQGKKVNHPEGEWLGKLGEVLAGRMGAGALERWGAWSNTGQGRKGL